jgi:hypothetical protein
MINQEGGAKVPVLGAEKSLIRTTWSGEAYRKHLVEQSARPSYCPSTIGNRKKPTPRPQSSEPWRAPRACGRASNPLVNLRLARLSSACSSTVPAACAGLELRSGARRAAARLTSIRVPFSAALDRYRPGNGHTTGHCGGSNPAKRGEPGDAFRSSAGERNHPTIYCSWGTLSGPSFRRDQFAHPGYCFLEPHPWGRGRRIELAGEVWRNRSKRSADARCASCDCFAKAK